MCPARPSVPAPVSDTLPSMDDIGSPQHVRRNSSQAEKALAFFLRFLNQPKQVGSIVPSSAFLERRLVVEDADVAVARPDFSEKVLLTVTVEHHSR